MYKKATRHVNKTTKGTRQPETKWSVKRIPNYMDYHFKEVCRNDGNMSSAKYVRDVQSDLRWVFSQNKNSTDLIDEINFGKYKGYSISQFGETKEESRYLAQMLYRYRNDSKKLPFIMSMLLENPLAQHYVNEENSFLQYSPCPVLTDGGVIGWEY